jgi:hypothetical protein
MSTGPTGGEPTGSGPSGAGAESTGVVVLGMHRSGTSAVCRLVNLLGADVGPKEDLLTEYDNPSGHWENKSLIKCNDNILDAFGRSWDFPPWLSDGWEADSRLSSLRTELLDTFTSVYANARSWVWKDPRTCLTLPLWRKVIPGRFVVVLVFRDPVSVAASLRRRDGIPRAYAAGLWHHYVRTALRGARGLPVLCTKFEDLVSSPASFTQRLAQDLGSMGVHLEGDREEAARSIDAAHDGERASDRLVDTLTSSVAGTLRSLPANSAEFVPPSWSEPRWVRPLLTAYRVQWVVRSRTGHPLRPRLA